MRNRRKLLWILFACALAAVLILLLLMLWREREPYYHEKSLSQWAHIVDLGPHDETETLKAEEAIRQIGTNGLPFLSRWVQYEEKPWRRRLATICDKLPEKLGSRLSDFIIGHGSERQQEAFSALYILGSNAIPAIPTLKMLVERNASAAGTSVIVLAHLGDAGLPPVLTVLTNPAQAAVNRINAIDEIGRSWAQFTSTDAVASALTACLDDKEGKVAITAARVLCSAKCEPDRAIQTFLRVINGNHKALAKDAIWDLQKCLQESFPRSALIQFLQDTNSPFSAYVPGAFTDMTDTTVIPILTNSLRDPRPLVRSSAAIALGPFGWPAESAAPALLDLWNDTDVFVRRAATNAFFELPSYKILRHVNVLTQLDPGMSEEQRAMYIRRYWIDPKRPNSLTQLFDDPDPRVRKLATNAFQKLNASITRNQPAENPSR